MSNKICTKGVWDETVPGIKFNEEGISNYYFLQKKLEETFPRGEKGTEIWDNLVNQIKKEGKNNEYNCIVGVSGGVDSSYLLYILKEKYGLRPLAVNLDNGWSSKIAVSNIHKITKSLNIDLETYVIDYEEIKDVLRAYIRAGLPWIDFPTDIAISGSLYKIANKENIKYILRGNDFRSEGKQPKEWTYSDHRQLKYIHKKFGNLKKLKSFPFFPKKKLLYYSLFKNIKDIRPFYYIDYTKQDAKKILIENFEWEDYGGHHHENLFTKFVMAYWLPKKFKIDKRIINLSAQIVSGAIKREDAIKKLEVFEESETQLESSKEYFLKKIGISDEEFSKIWSEPNKSFLDYPSDYHLINKFYHWINPISKYIFKQKPMSLIEMEERKSK